VGDTWTNPVSENLETLTLVDAVSPDGFARVTWAVEFSDFPACNFEYTFTVPLTAGFGQSQNVPVVTCNTGDSYLVTVEGTLSVLANQAADTSSPPPTTANSVPSEPVEASPPPTTANSVQPSPPPTTANSVPSEPVEASSPADTSSSYCANAGPFLVLTMMLGSLCVAIVG